jgi:hypothetical protein
MVYDIKIKLKIGALPMFAASPSSRFRLKKRGAAATRSIHIELLRSNSASPGAKVARCRSPVSNGPGDKLPKTSWREVV